MLENSKRADVVDEGSLGSPDGPSWYQDVGREAVVEWFATLQRSHRVQKIYRTVGSQNYCSFRSFISQASCMSEGVAGTLSSLLKLSADALKRNLSANALRRWPRCWQPPWLRNWCSANSTTCNKTTVHIIREENRSWITTHRKLLNNCSWKKVREKKERR